MASCSIHPRAVVQGGATIGARSRIGPFCMIGPEVVLGEGCILESQVMVTGRTTVGPRTRIFPFASLGPEPQNVKYAGEPSTLTIGSDCIIREGVTIHPGTANGRMTTIVGDRCVCLAHSHVAHDCVVGNDVVLSSHVMLAGHCTIQDCVTIGEGAGIHQFVRIGRHACVGEMSAVENDVIPYGLAVGNRAHLAGLNMAGLHRCGFTPEQIHGLRRAYRLLFADEGTLSERMEDVAAEFTSDPFVQDLLEFIRSGQDRGICTPREPA